jgi:type I restriction enzyme, S subunit
MREGWETKRLGELAELKGRIGWRGLTAKEYTKEGPLFLSVHSLNYGDYVDFRDAFHISEERYAESPEIMLEPSDVLICKDGAGIGKVGIVGDLPRRATINSSLLLIRGGESIVPKFLYYCLLSPYFQAIVQSRLNGATTPHLYQRDITGFPVVLPPLPEQQRIVALLEEAFAGLATAKANAEQNLQNARAIFESHLQSVYSQRGEGWVETTLDKISTNLDSRRVPITKNVRSSGEYPYYGASGIVDYVVDYIFEGDNLLVSEDGANLLARSTPIAFSVTGRYWVNNHAHILHFESMATQRFVEFYLESIKLDEFITGAAQPKLNQRALNTIPIPIPESVEEQANIVKGVELLQEETQHLTCLYERKLAALDELKKSLLHQAFKGEL